ncbi:ferric reductase-like transmembrane domain-containing protein [Paeniclostridium sordellii]|uniref:ferric reductase-like transmembrane domain-containing protein n=1 Tax=Paraclostridium sordellii TaxID=1505 RepID=UPI002149CD5F|nr:ferric reductase-like transmembrane domain-containing protein [Paeniclostridium sordellii]MCR1850336.1 ferric reductase-like transmembrane domain-containing protein [Paeniclostridium sordellii]
MLLIISLILTTFLSIVYYKQIKKHSTMLYIIATLIAIFFIIFMKSNLNEHIPKYISKFVIGVFSKGTISLALFTIVMCTGVLDNSFKFRQNLMAVRGELSIIACILTLGHNVLYGMYFFPTFFTNMPSLSISKIIATLLSLIMICLMIPLMITSFKSVRKKMSYKAWKKIQRSAYIFYGIMYIHIMLLYIPKFNSKLFEIILYSIIFLSYYFLRIRKFFKDKNKVKA